MCSKTNISLLIALAFITVIPLMSTTAQAQGTGATVWHDPTWPPRRETAEPKNSMIKEPSLTENQVAKSPTTEMPATEVPTLENPVVLECYAKIQVDPTLLGDWVFLSDEIRLVNATLAKITRIVPNNDLQERLTQLTDDFVSTLLTMQTEQTLQFNNLIACDKRRLSVPVS